tara:strand:+ start:112 stop:393 length:282 start_codon:yes stop_codon:yes gene_type:complete
MYKNKKEIKEAVEHLKEEMRWHQYLKQWEKDNLIQWEDYFRYSGETEEYKELCAKWRYDENTMCNILHEHFKTIKDDKKNTSRVIQGDSKNNK